MGRKRRSIGRDISGVLLLNKPSGVTSNAILQEIKKIFFAKKAGHTGSLDPLATGMLPICFGEATKYSHYLLNSDKKYRVTCKLGITTDSADSDGIIIEEKEVSEISSKFLQECLDSFLGSSMQTPPMHSAIKVDGEPLYKKAHKGEVVEREPRNIVIYSFDVVKKSFSELILDVHCSKGTYVRTLIEDLGKMLGFGAHVSGLHRTALSFFSDEEMVTLEEITECFNRDDKFLSLNNLLLPVGEMTRGFNEVVLSPDEKFYIKNGQAVRVGNSPETGMVSMYFADKFIGVGLVLEDGRIEPKRLVKNI